MSDQDRAGPSGDLPRLTAAQRERIEDLARPLGYVGKRFTATRQAVKWFAATFGRQTNSAHDT